MMNCMQTSNMKLFIAACSFLALLSCSSNDKELPYSNNADPVADYSLALSTAKTNNKLVMLIFGANWCPDCIELDRQLNTSPLKELINENYELVKVNVGEFDENLDFIKNFGKPLVRGIPSIVITDADETISFISTAGELSSIRKMHKGDAQALFKKITTAVRSH